MTERVAVLGGGKLGEALLSGLLRAGRAPADVVVAERSAEQGARLRETYGIEVLDVAAAASEAGIVVLAVKPQDMAALLEQLTPALPAGALVVSVAAGIPTAFLEERLPPGTAVVRVMPNTPVLVDQAMTAISGGRHAAPAHLDAVEEMFRAVGRTLRVPESQLDAVTALSGSGPAYFFYLVEAMTDAGILLGLPRQVAHDLIVQTAIGSAIMLRDSGEHPVTLREAVMSPAGTTIAAIRTMEDHGVRAAMLAALEAARDRSRELASGNG